VGSVPTYPAPTQHTFLISGLVNKTVASRELLFCLCLLLPAAASSSASRNLNACKTGLKVRLLSGVVGAVEISKKLSSVSTAEEEEGGGWFWSIVRAAEVEWGIGVSQMDERYLNLVQH
jgi:hypothetical protein